jgi:glycosyltransferase involved in cell wall biosynthesis
MRDLTGLTGYRTAWVLIRYRGTPVAYSPMQVTAGRVPAAELWTAAARSTPGSAGNVLADLIARTEKRHKAPLPPASVVVCTRDRPDDLARCLGSALPLLGPDVEMLVIDNRPSDDRSERIAGMYPVRYFRQQRRGLNWARAEGVRQARHEIVLFTDDDVVLDAGWADALRRVFIDPSVGGATGLVLPFECETEAQEAFERYCGFSRGMVRTRFRAAVTPPLGAGAIGAGASMAIRRQLALDLGVFEIELDAGTATRSGGDSYAFYRLLRAGYDAVYEPEAVAWHRHRRTATEVHDTVYGYSVGVFCFWLACLFIHGDWRVLNAGPRWFADHHLRWLVRTLRGDRRRPRELVLAEIRGAFHAPAAYWRSLRAGPRPARRTAGAE